MWCRLDPIPARASPTGSQSLVEKHLTPVNRNSVAGSGGNLWDELFFGKLVEYVTDLIRRIAVRATIRRIGVPWVQMGERISSWVSKRHMPNTLRRKII
jgi:hypothetical protein